MIYTPVKEVEAPDFPSGVVLVAGGESNRDQYTSSSMIGTLRTAEVRSLDTSYLLNNYEHFNESQ